MSFASPYPVHIPTTSVYEYLFGGIADEDADRVAWSTPRPAPR